MNIKTIRETLHHAQWALLVIALFTIAFRGIISEAITFKMMIRVTCFTAVCLGMQYACTSGFFETDGSVKRQDPFLWILFGALTFILASLAIMTAPLLFKENMSVSNIHALYFSLAGWTSLLSNGILIVRFYFGRRCFSQGHHPDHTPAWE